MAPALTSYTAGGRSFGDAYLKYPEFNGPAYADGDRSRGRHVPDPYTPPYITHQPEVIVRKLTEDDVVRASISPFLALCAR